MNLASSFLFVKADQVMSQGDIEITLTGRDLTIEDLVRIARYGVKVQAHHEYILQAQRSHQFLWKAALQGRAIYGLNRLLGPNSNSGNIFKHLTNHNTISSASEAFNRSVIFSHCAGFGENLDIDIVRATMLVRVNTLLQGQSGCHPRVVQLLIEFLNRGIHPIVPSKGSVGEADINILSHVGLAMLGGGYVNYNDKLMLARDVLDLIGLEPLHPIGKDALSIVSSNAYSSSRAALLVRDLEELLTKANLIYALSLEALNGNVSPLFDAVNRMRPYAFQEVVARQVRGYLEGSYLWRLDPVRGLQDPLSFRNACVVHAAAYDSIDYAKRRLLIQLNSAEDNPAVVLGVDHLSDLNLLMDHCIVQIGENVGAILHNANYESLPYVLALEMLNISLGHVVSLSCQRSMRLIDVKTSKLSVLTQDHSLVVLQKTASALYARARQFCTPASLDHTSLAYGVEDHATNSVQVVENLHNMMHILEYLLAIEILCASQIIEFMTTNTYRELGNSTRNLLYRFNANILSTHQDFIITDVIESTRRFLKDM